MARSLETLRSRYNSGTFSRAVGKRAFGPASGKPGQRRGMQALKPKNAKGTIKRLLAYMSEYKLHVAAGLVSLFVSTISTLLGSYLLFPIVNRIAGVETTEENAGALAVRADGMIESFCQKLRPVLEPVFGSRHSADVLIYIFSALIILASVYLVGVASTYTERRVMLSASQGALAKIRSELFQKIQDLPVKYFDGHPTGEVMSRFTNDVDTIGTMFDTSLINMIGASIKLTGTLIFMISTNLILTAVMLIFVPLILKCGTFIAKNSRKYFKGQQEALGAVNGYIEETVSGQKIVKVFNHETECMEEFSLLNDDLREKQFKAQFFGGIMGPVMGNSSQISYAVTIGVGGILMCTAGFTPGALTVFAQYARQFAFPINNISQQMTAIFSALAGAERVFAVMDAKPEPQSPADAYRGEIQGSVEFRNVTFGYNPEKIILKNLFIKANKGQKIAFVGSTGAGKTTITNLLNRFYDIQQGEILIDDRPIREFDRDYLRQNIATVLQDTHLFTGTVMENIRYGRLDATDEEVIEAAKTASAHPFIMKLSHGYQTVLEGDGANLSQGQRQLINIARAAISKAPILVLDEATSSVDTRTERHIEIGMDRLMKSRTTFVIAHRLSTVRNSDAIMVLEKGEIIEQGTHDELLKQGGRYYELYTGMRELD